MKSDMKTQKLRGGQIVAVCFLIGLSSLLTCLYVLFEGSVYSCTCDDLTPSHNVTEFIPANDSAQLGGNETEVVDEAIIAQDSEANTEVKAEGAGGSKEKGYQNISADKIVFSTANGVTDTGAFIVDANYTYRCDESLAAEFKKLFAQQTVLELGAGKGQYTHFIAETASSVHAYDGVPGIEDLTGGKVKNADLTNHLNLGIHDWVLCLEVGEHVPVEFELEVVSNLHRHNSKGVILSWAIPGQGGFHHVNNRPNGYIRGIFKSLGYKSNRALEKKLRTISTLDWFKKTIMVFERVEPGPKN